MTELLAGPSLLDRAHLALEVPLASALGLRLLDEDDPAAGASFEVRGLAGNGAGSAHASAVSAALELAGYLALVPQLHTDEHALTHASSVTLIGAAADGARVEVRGTVDRRARRLAFVSALASVDGSTIARAVLTKSIVAFQTQ